MRHRFRKSLLAVAAAGSLLLSTLPEETAGAAGTGCVQKGDYTVCRTDPGYGIDTSIVTELVRQIGRADGGDTVRAAVFQWTLDPPVRAVTEAMVRAKRRGADVEIVIGQRRDRPSQNTSAITRLERAGVEVVQCEGACLPNPEGSSRGPNHNRFFLIESDGRPTVITTSFNLTRLHVTQAHNLLAVHGDRTLHDFYLSYWQRLHGGDWDGWGERDKAASGDRTRAWVFPRSSDPVAAQLSYVTGCGGEGRVWVAHSNFQPNRPAVRAELERIADMGCDVRVVVLDKDTNDPAWIASRTGDGSVRVHDSLRGKFFLVQAEFNGRASELVWAGTHNLSRNSLKHADDNLLRVRSEAVVGVYADYFLQLWRDARLPRR